MCEVVTFESLGSHSAITSAMESHSSRDATFFVHVCAQLHRMYTSSDSITHGVIESINSLTNDIRISILHKEGTYSPNYQNHTYKIW